MKNVQFEVILELTKKMSLLFGEYSTDILKVSHKEDKSLVTEVDLFVSTLVKGQLESHEKFKHYTFFSEEEFSQLDFPVAILDPIDGTRELSKGIPECALSLALMKSPLISDPENYGWILNPFTGFSLDSSMLFTNSNYHTTQKVLGLVSRSEFDKGYFNSLLKIDSRIDISPRGSIAFKLGLLASGGCDFVLSLSPKNIWDIAAGTILCNSRGIKLYQNGSEIKELKELRVQGILLWAREDLAMELWTKFRNEKNSSV